MALLERDFDTKTPEFVGLVDYEAVYVSKVQDV